MIDLAWWALQPSSLMVLALALAYLLGLAGRARALRRLLGLVLLLLAALMVLPLTEWLAAPLEARYPPRDTLPGAVDGIVVLGGSVEGAATRARDQLQLRAAGERMVAGAALAQRYPDATLVLTGIDEETLAGELVGEPGPNTFLFGEAFADRDVRIVSSRSTYEDALAARRAVARGSDETWLLVTSAWHMPRARATFATLGWTLTPYPVDYLSFGREPFDGGLPAMGERLARFDGVVREWGALLVYRALGRIDGTFLPWNSEAAVLRPALLRSAPR